MNLKTLTPALILAACVALPVQAQNAQKKPNVKPAAVEKDAAAEAADAAARAAAEAQAAADEAAAAASAAAQAAADAVAGDSTDVRKSQRYTLATAISNRDNRSAENVARDKYRHPAETLKFFQVGPTSKVIEITPGKGWYTEILAPFVLARGSYTAALTDPQAVPAGGGRDFQQKQADTFLAFVNAKRADRKSADAFLNVHTVRFDPAAPAFGAPGSADVLLTFRNVHNWVKAETAQKYFDGFFKVLKKGGVLGVVDHRAKPGTDLETMKSSGYLTEALVIEYAKKAGFVLEAKSQINANAKDDTKHPKGVWMLPPTNSHDAVDDAKYKAIGESDRMTLRFRKP